MQYYYVVPKEVNSSETLVGSKHLVNGFAKSVIWTVKVEEARPLIHPTGILGLCQMGSLLPSATH